jgi:trimeric autotransporter adhesin
MSEHVLADSRRAGRPCGRGGRSRILSVALVVAAVAAALALDGGVAAASPSPTPDTTAGTNGDVLAIVQVGTRTYLGGSFSWAGPFTGSGVVVGDSDGRRIGATPRVNGPVRSAVTDGAGGWYIGGEFTFVNGQPRARIAHLLPSGAVTAWNPGADGPVLTLAVGGSKIYAGGSFATVGGQARSNLAAVDAATGAATAWDPAANGPVNALALSGDGGRLYAGGAFAAVGGQQRGNLAAVDTATGAVLGWDPGANGPVNALALSADGTRLYVGGAFAAIGGQARNNLAAVDAATAAALGWNPGPSGPVHTLALAADGTRLYAGGAFTSIGGQARGNAAAVDTTTGAATAWDPSAEAAVHAIAPAGSRLLVGGAFRMLNGRARNNLAAIDATTGEVDLAWNPDANNQVRSLAPSSDGSRIFVGGTFTRLGGKARGRIGAVDAVTGAVANWNPGTVGGVRAVAVGGDRVYIGGNFTSVGGVARTRLAAVDATTGAVDPAFAPTADAEVRALAVTPDGTRLYAVGYFKAIAGVARPGAASLDPTTGAATSFSPSTGGAAIALALSPDATRFYFSTTSNRTYAYAPAAGNTPVWTLRTGGDVQAVAASASEVYVGGHFTNLPVEKLSRLHLASVNAATGTATSWDPRPDGAFGVWALTALPGALLAGGDFDKVGGKTQPRFARFTGTP